MAKLENKTKENPKLEQNKLSDGRISLYLEYYLGREEKPVLDENGNQVYYESGKMQGKPKFAIKHHRRKENLSLYLIDTYSCGTATEQGNFGTRHAHTCRA